MTQNPVYELLTANLTDAAREDGLIRADAAADVAAAAMLTLPAAPWLAVLRIRHSLDIHDHEAALALSDALQRQAGAIQLVVLGDDAELTMLDDEDLSRLGLIRTDRAVDLIDDHFLTCRHMTPSCLEPMLRDTPTTGVDEIPD